MDQSVAPASTIPVLRPLDLLARFAWGYLFLLPGAGLAALLYVVIAERTWARGDALLSVPFFFLGAAPLVAGAARVVGLTNRSLLGFAWERTNAFILSGIMYWIGLFIYMIAWGIPMRIVFGPTEAWGASADRFLYVVIAVSIWLATRFWPALATKYIYRGEMGVPHYRWGRHWQGPGLGGAFLMTRTRGAFVRATLPVAIMGIAPIWLLVELRALVDGDVAGWITVAIHLVLVPWATLLVVERAAHLRLESEAWVNAGEPPELERHESDAMPDDGAAEPSR